MKLYHAMCFIAQPHDLIPTRYKIKLLMFCCSYFGGQDCWILGLSLLNCLLLFYAFPLLDYRPFAKTSAEFMTLSFILQQRENLGSKSRTFDI